MSLALHTPAERISRLVRRIVWRIRKLLDPSLLAISALYANKQYFMIDRLDRARMRWGGLHRLVGGRYLLSFPGHLTPTERGALLTLQEAEVVVPRICRQVVKDALRDPEGRRPIFVGPWTTEIGFELLYWIPFIRHFARRHEAPSQRLIAISRGGTAGWYEGVCDRYVDLFDLIDVDTFLRETSRREEDQGGKKGFGLAPPAFDRDIYLKAAEHLGFADYGFLPPSTMYVLFRNIWRGRYSADRLLKSLDIEPMSVRYERPKLPFSGPYSVLKFYSSSNFKTGPETSEFIRLLIAHLGRSAPVVLLNTGAKLDDHDDVNFDGGAQAFDAAKLYTPRDNLAVQSALVAHSQSLHCTYGGFAYLGPLLGIPTVCYFTEPNFVGTHLDLAIRQLEPSAGLLAVSPVRVALEEMRKVTRHAKGSRRL